MIDTKDLLIFQTVARTGSFSKAAQELCYVQSNITGRIHKLEEQFKTTLFHRHGRGVILTSTGKTLLSYVGQILNLLNESQRMIQDEENTSGSLSIGATDITTAVRIPSIISDFHDHYPDVHLSLKTGYTKKLVDSVLKYEIDGAFITGPIDHPEIFSEVMVDEKVVLIHSFKEQMKSISDLCGKTLLVFGHGCTYRLMLENCLQENGIIPSNKIEFGTIEGMLGCVKAGLGATVVPEIIYQQLKDEKQIFCCPLPEKYSKVQTVFIRRKSVHEFLALKNFLKSAKNVVNKEGRF
ncbi:LysR family transcriptional regulator [Bacillus smithii]|uniref:LysR family transcriptional regulator n=1 Tax=Bacillus smithii TaxID=1479 RepID=UPI002E1FD880|nr:LysR family transcriptional regulator [Bacillus smithii]MED1457528.1 LysR family transcriptional regulator [Bacillus smithii]